MFKPVRLQHGFRMLELSVGPRIGAIGPRGQLSPLASKQAALDVLRPLLTDSLQMVRLRAAMAGRYGPTELNDQDLLDYVARDLAAGRLLVRSSLPTGAGAGQLSAPELEPEPSAERSEQRQAWIELQVLHESGYGYPNVRVELTLPTGERRAAALDGDSCVRLDGWSESGACSLVFAQPLLPPDPATSSTVAPIPVDGSILNVPRTHPGSLRLSCNQTHRIVIQRPRLYLLQMADVHFQTARSVLLPHVGSQAEVAAAAGRQVTGLGVMARALRFAAQYPEKRLLVAGHTDSVGSAASNVDLSDARATNVMLYLAGPPEAWAAHCQQHHAADDAQRLLKWAARTRGWPCDPGEVDGQFGRRSRAALQAFRRRVKRDLGIEAGSGRQLTLADWQAIFALYDDVLAAVYDDSEQRADLARLRSSLSFTQPASLACGEYWPTSGVTLDDYTSAEDRRVDLFFFDEDEIPADLGGQDPPGRSIYGEQLFVLEPISPDEHELPDSGVCFEFTLDVGDPDWWPRSSLLRLATDGLDIGIGFADARRIREGLLRFHFHDVLTDALYTLSFERDGYEPHLLFENQSIDAFLDHIGNLDQPIEPLHVNPLPLPELDGRPAGDDEWAPDDDEPRRLDMLQLEDVHFNLNSAMLLPGGLEVGSAAPDRLSGLSVLRACLQYARANPTHRILVVGHTDVSGEPDYNLALSEKRARNLLSLLRGDRDEWVRISLDTHTPKGLQAALQWASTFEWPCDPGDIDGDIGPNTREAIKEFQAHYNFIFGKSIAVDGDVGPQTMGGLFDLYERSLALSLHIDPRELARQRAALQYVGAGYVGCGEAYPIEGQRVSATDRRVDVLFLKPDQQIDLTGDPPLQQVYGPGGLERRFISELVIQADGRARGGRRQPPHSFGLAAGVRLRAVVVGPAVAGSYDWQCDSDKVRLEAEGGATALATVELIAQPEPDEIIEVTCTLEAAGRRYRAEHRFGFTPHFFLLGDESLRAWAEVPGGEWEQLEPEEATT